MLIIAIDCGSLTTPDNGLVIESGTLLGDIASYICNNGYMLVGGKMRYCQGNGEWAGNEPFCSGQPCSYPVIYCQHSTFFTNAVYFMN